MSHIHIPDGVLPVWLWLTGWLVAALAVLVASRVSQREDIRRKVPLLGVVSALVLVAMSTEIVPIAYHINLTVVAGVLLGPWLSIIAAFIVQLVLAMLGHGGVTVIGLNTIQIGTEMVLGGALFRLLTRVLGRARVRPAAAMATVVALAVTTTMLVGLVALAGAGPAAARDTGALNPATLRFKSPFSGGVMHVGLFSGGERPAADTGRSVRRFAAIVYTLGPIGWAIEALITAAVLGYVARVRPSLVFSGALAEPSEAHIGDENGRR